MFSELIEKIKKAEKIAIFNHENPDGDALGSAFALKLALQGIGKCAEVFLRDGDDETKEYNLMYGTEKENFKIEDCDLKIAVDCADIARIGTLSEQFCGNTAAIDHHVTHVPFADTTVVAADAPATGEIIFDLVNAMGAELTKSIAHNLYVAITCDTGSFKFSSTTPKTHMVAAELMKLEIDIAEISKVIFDTKSFKYLQAYKFGIEQLEMYENGRIALLAFEDADFAKLGIDEKGADGIVGLPRCVEGAEVGVYIRQRGENEFKVSLRANGSVDVSKVAMEFGGGGHVRASGCTLNMTLEDAKTAVVKAIKKFM